MKLNRTSSNEKFDSSKLVTNPDIFDKTLDKRSPNSDQWVIKKSFSPNGLFSEELFGRVDAEVDYSCKCGKYQGKFYEGLKCDECGTEVQYVMSNINKIGWIDLGENYLIKYIGYQFLEKIIGIEALRNIIKLPGLITINGELDQEAIEAKRNESPTNRYYYYGIREFKKNYDEIIAYYYDLNFVQKNQQDKCKDLYEFIKNPENVFINKIIVLPIALRPAQKTPDGIKLHELNVLYQQILKYLTVLNDPTTDVELIKETTTEQIQASYQMLCENAIENIKGKSGLIRMNICGTRVNYSARNIISPAKSRYHIDEIVLPYLTFLELWKYELINVIHRLKNISYVEAERVWFNATLRFDTEVYDIVCKIINDQEIGVLLNRNPSLAVGSILYLKVAAVKKDYSDNTMSISNTICSVLGADYDGDVLNLISIKDVETREVYKRIFSPIALIVNPNDGHFNNVMNLERDQVLGMNTLLI